jgi:hypothetical protein
MPATQWPQNDEVVDARVFDVLELVLGVEVVKIPMLAMPTMLETVKLTEDVEAALGLKDEFTDVVVIPYTPKGSHHSSTSYT